MSVDVVAAEEADDLEIFRARQAGQGGLVARIQSILHRYPALSPALVLLVACIVFTFFGNGRFARLDTTGSILQQTTVVGVLAIGQTIDRPHRRHRPVGRRAAMVFAHLVMAQVWP